MINNLVVMSIGIVGILVTLLTIVPFFLYSKDIVDFQRTGITFIESVTKNFIVHLTICFVVIFFISAWGMIADIGISSSFSPKIGVEGFLNLGGNGSLYDYWSSVGKDLAHVNYSNNQFTQKGEKFIAYSLILCVYLGHFFWLIIWFTPLLIVFVPSFLALRYYKRHHDNFQGYLPYFKYMIIAIGILIMVYLHFAIVDILINSMSDHGFKTFDASAKIWKSAAGL